MKTTKWIIGRAEAGFGFAGRTGPYGRPGRSYWTGFLAIFALIGRLQGAEEPPLNLERMTVAMLPLENRVGDPKATDWSLGGAQCIVSGLENVKSSLRPLRNDQVMYGLRRLGIEPGSKVTLEQAREVGQIIEARRIIWGGYGRSGDQWEAAVRILNVADGTASAEIKASSTNWYDIRDRIDEQILKELGVSPSAEELARMKERDTDSPAVMELLAKVHTTYEQGRPYAELETEARKAVQIDPHSVDTHMVLAVSLANQGKFKPAEEFVREALRLDPGRADAYQVLGVMHTMQGDTLNGEIELRQACRLDPDNSETWLRLGELCLNDGRRESALHYLDQARRLNPTDGNIRAKLGYAYAARNERTKALAELQEAERLCRDGEETGAEQGLCDAYLLLHETSLALSHCEEFVASAGKSGLNPEIVARYRGIVGELKTRLTVNYITNAPPKIYTAASLEEELHRRLAAAECKLVVNPLASTPEMDAWAGKLVNGATDDLDKARRLFDALVKRFNRGGGGTHTAKEVFDSWNDLKTSFWCAEYARLYVALARAVGLQSYFVIVDQDPDGKLVSHACAVVYIKGKGVLVDANYLWFGVPHRAFSICDDLQAVAYHLSDESDMRKRRLAVKLQPDAPYFRFALALGLMQHYLPNWNPAADLTELKEARAVLKQALTLDPDSHVSYYAQGCSAVCGLDWATAVELLRKSLALNPDFSQAHDMLAFALSKQFKLKEALEEYRAALRLAVDPAEWRYNQFRISQLNEQLGNQAVSLK